MTTGENDVLVDVKNLTMWFPITQGIIIQRTVGHVKAVDAISFYIHKGETLGLVGESGCGKSTTGRAMLQLYRPTAGEVFFEGRLGREILDYIYGSRWQEYKKSGRRSWRLFRRKKKS